jgi:hypothetical protein
MHAIRQSVPEPLQRGTHNVVWQALPQDALCGVGIGDDIGNPGGLRLSEGAAIVIIDRVRKLPQTA